MASVVTTSNGAFGAITILNTVNKVESIFAAIDDYRLARKTRKELSKLTMRQLEDIGLDYTDIKKIR